MSSTGSLGTPELGSAAQRDRRQRILDATVGLASRGGYDAVQMRAVADRADVALGTLYRYFPSKVHLLVSALGRELRRAEAARRDVEVPGDSASERVVTVLQGTTRDLQSSPQLTEALTRALMFADASVRAEAHQVGVALSTMLTRAMHPGRAEPTEDDVAIARIIADLWLAALVGWATGRTTAAETADHVERAVHLLLRG